MSKNVNNDVTINPPIQSQHMKTFHQTMRLVFDMNSAKMVELTERLQKDVSYVISGIS